MVKRSPISFIIWTFLILLAFIAIPHTPASANETGQVIMTDGNLNVRSEPSTQGDIVGKLQNGDEVQIIKRTGEWLKISSESAEGFVHSDYIKVQTTTNKTSTTDQSKATDTTKTTNAAKTPNPSSSSKKISVYVNGELLNLPIEPPIIDGRVLVPFRGIGETLGITVKWLEKTKQVEAIDAETKVVFTINKSKVMVNNEALAINPAPTIVKNYTVLPLRFFAESYGANVQWNEKERKVIIEQKTATEDREETSSPKSTKEEPVIEDAVRTTTTAIIDAVEDTSVYKEPSTNSRQLGELAQGDSIKVYDKAVAKNLHTNEWLEIEYRNDIGYITADSIRPQKEVIKGKVNATTLNIRENADANSPVIGAYTKGQEINVFKVEGQWAQVKYNDQWGYVHTNYLTMQVNKQPFTALAQPQLETYDGNRAWLKWSKVGSVTTSHSFLSNGVEITTSASQIDEWAGNHPAIDRIDYSGSKIRIYFNPGYHFVVRHYENEVKVTLLNSGLVGKRIVVDAGHGDHDPGAKGPTGAKEKDVNLAVATYVADLLRGAGADVTLTRSNDTFLSLAERVKVAHNNDADAFVSIHSDSFNATSQGSTTFYHSGKNPSWQQSKRLSDIAIKKITSQLGTVSRGSQDKSLHVIRETEIPAILVEMAFISNPNEEALLKSDEFRQNAAQAIYDSFVQFYE
ncbi:MAG TPA: SH3 domain-containing protein [Bacillales bacterium]|nr:SH3 domain-containing protein [Bacillales bacterium]